MNAAQWASGAVAGAVAALAFTFAHAFLIADIWFMLVPMLVAGAICGFCMSWSYSLLVDTVTTAGWLRYNALFLLLLFLLGPLSLLIFDPVITMPALLASDSGLPAELRQAVLPLAIIYALAMTAIVTWLYGRRWRHAGVVLLTSTVLMLLLGLNIAAMGLVFLTSSWVPALLKFLSLILVLNGVLVGGFLLLMRGWSAGASFGREAVLD